MSETQISEEAWAQIKQALFDGQKIEAIKLHREHSKSSLVEAKNAIDSLDAELRVSNPEKFGSPAAGCLGLVVLCLLGFIFLL